MKCDAYINNYLFKYTYIANDGQALVWDLDVNAIKPPTTTTSGGGGGNSKNLILPIAKLDVPILGSNLSKASIIYDKLLDHLHISCNDKKIRY